MDDFEDFTEDQEEDHLMKRRTRSEMEGDDNDIAESSAARRRESRILDRWATMQAAQAMITTIERRNQESDELIALASLHVVSTLDSSFLQSASSSTSSSSSRRRQASVTEIPRTQASRIVQMWRDLEDEQLLNRERGRFRERLRQRNTDFAHRNRINQSLLRGRNETGAEEARAPSMAASVSGLQELTSHTNGNDTSNTNQTIPNATESSNSSRLENDISSLTTDSNRLGANQANADRNWEENTYQERIWPEIVNINERQNPQESMASQSNDNGEENSVEGNRVRIAGNSRQSNGRSRRRVLPMRRLNRFHSPHNDENFELQELGNRRSVSNLLRSGFRESLDQFIQSFAQRRGLDHHIDWGLQAPRTDHHHHQEQPLQTPPVRPVLQPMHRSYFEWEMMNELRRDMNGLKEGMNNMQKMLETCVDMHSELHRLIKQEVSAALNRSNADKGVVGVGTSEDGLKWSNVRSGTCCICCDNDIDALLYRCGHMCSCSKCANELMRTGEKCPLCRAPIVEVIRAYTIQ